MFKKPSWEIPPFCQRSSPEIADDVLHASINTLNCFFILRDELRDVTSAPRCENWSLSPGEIHDVLNYHRDMVAWVARLGEYLENVSGWWFTNPPPAFAPGFISSAEAVLFAAAQLDACLSAPRPDCFEAVTNVFRAIEGDLPATLEVPFCEEFSILCLYASEVAEEYPYLAAGAALKTEAMSIALRPPPSSESLICGSGMWKGPNKSKLKWSEVKTMTVAKAKRTTRPLIYGPIGFAVWQQERADKGPDAKLDTSVSTDQSRFVLSRSQRRILECLEGASLRRDELIEASKIPHTTLMRHLKGLRERGLVESDPKAGYYRPDSPPPDPKSRADRSR